MGERRGCGALGIGRLGLHYRLTDPDPDPDHLWGAIDDFDDSERFPNARYVMPAAKWDFWIRE